MSNQASEELRRAIGECLGIFPEEFDEYLPSNVGKKNIDAIEHLIRTEKLKLLAAVRERVVGEDRELSLRELSRDMSIDDAIEERNANIHLNYFKVEQRAELSKLEAEL